MSYFELNKASWNQRALLHFESSFYDVEGFLAGNTSLREIELRELTDVAGKRLLHLQCHFGLDTLSWARAGAKCTGVDISPVAIEKAKQLAKESTVSADFVCTDLYSYAPDPRDLFDIVYTSYGTICWLPDLDRWAQLIASALKVGGRFYMAEFHPIHDLLTGYSYFEKPEPDIEEESTYTENAGEEKLSLATWGHPLSRVLNALIGAGISIERVNEFPFSPYNCFEGLVEKEPGRFYLSHNDQFVPMVYSITGRKENPRNEVHADQ